MKYITYILLTTALTGGFACTKDQKIQQTIIFGRFYGFCQGEACIEIFKLEGGHLYEDQNDKYPDFRNVYNANYVQRSQASYELVKTLEIPDVMWKQKDTVYGCVDCHDQGGIYIELNKDGKRRFWYIATDYRDLTKTTFSFPNEVIDRVRDAVEKLQ